MSTTDEEEERGVEMMMGGCKIVFETLKDYKVLGNNMIVTGPSGCGKSLMVLCLLNRTDNNIARMYIVAHPERDMLWELVKEQAAKQYGDAVTFYECIEDLPTCKQMKKEEGNALVIVDEETEYYWDRPPKELSPYICEDDISIIMTMQTKVEKFPRYVNAMFRVADFYAVDYAHSDLLGRQVTPCSMFRQALALCKLLYASYFFHVILPVILSISGYCVLWSGLCSFL
jgi:hypothetical protein